MTLARVPNGSNFLRSSSQVSDTAELTVMLSIVVGSIALSALLGYEARDAAVYSEDAFHLGVGLQLSACNGRTPAVLSLMSLIISYLARTRGSQLAMRSDVVKYLFPFKSPFGNLPTGLGGQGRAWGASTWTRCSRPRSGPRHQLVRRRKPRSKVACGQPLGPSMSRSGRCQWCCEAPFATQPLAHGLFENLNARIVELQTWLH